MEEHFITESSFRPRSTNSQMQMTQGMSPQNTHTHTLPTQNAGGEGVRGFSLHQQFLARRNEGTKEKKAEISRENKGELIRYLKTSASSAFVTRQ